MSNSRVSLRYADSFLDLAVENNQLEVAHTDLKLVEKTIEDNRELELMLLSPLHNADKKEAVLTQIFQNKVQKETLTFIQLIVQKGREEQLKSIATTGIEGYRIRKNIVAVSVSSAVQLDDKLRADVLKLVESKVQGEIELVESVDTDLVGGFVVKIGDKMIDASVKRQLADLRKTFQ